MSFGASQSVKNAQNTQGGITNLATANSANLNNLGTTALGAGNTTLNSGAGTVSSGTNFWNTLLNGNQANTAAMLAPTLNADRAQQQATLQSTNTLTPRGGGRSGTLFNAAYQPTASIQNLFNTGRTTAASTLPQIGLAQENVGLGQQGIGTNLFNLGNSALNTATGSNATLLNNTTQEQQINNQLAGGVGSLFGSLLTAGVPGGGSILGNILFPPAAGCWIAESIYGENDIRTHTLRAWLNGPFKRTRHGKVIMAAYLAIGRQVAWLTQRSAWLRAKLRPMFESALTGCRSTFAEVS